MLDDVLLDPLGSSFKKGYIYDILYYVDESLQNREGGCEMRNWYDDPKVREILDIIVGKLFDSNPIRFNKNHKVKIPDLRGLFSSGNDGIFEFEWTPLRNTFLFNCREFTKNEPIEHLIIGYGRLRGGGTDIYQVQHIIGDENSVDIPESISQQITKWTFWVPNSNVIIYHNHPKHWINSLFGKTPTASQQDRISLLYNKYLNPIQAIKQFLFTGGQQYYLEEEGKVLEIKGAPLTEIIRLIKIALDSLSRS